MSNKTPRINNLDNQAVNLSFIDAPNTTIQNRAQIPDLANDLSAHLGVNRIPVQEVFPIESESGPNGEQVSGVVNDKFGQIRLIGNWENLANINFGPFPEADNSPTVAIEVTFFGTALKFLQVTRLK